MNWLLLASWLAPVSVLSQTGVDDPLGLVAAYGAAAPFALLCLWTINRKDKEIEALRADVAKVTEAGMGQVVPALVRATETGSEATKALESATVMMHTLAARGLSPEELARFTRLLRAMERRLDDAT